MGGMCCAEVAQEHLSIRVERSQLERMTSNRQNCANTKESESSVGVNSMKIIKKTFLRFLFHLSLAIRVNPPPPNAAAADVNRSKRLGSIFAPKACCRPFAFAWLDLNQTHGEMVMCGIDSRRAQKKVEKEKRSSRIVNSEHDREKIDNTMEK